MRGVARGVPPNAGQPARRVVQDVARRVDRREHGFAVHEELDRGFLPHEEPEVHLVQAWCDGDDVRPVNFELKHSDFELVFENGMRKFVEGKWRVEINHDSILAQEFYV